MNVGKLIDRLKSGSELDRLTGQAIERSHKFAFSPALVPVEILDGAGEHARDLMAWEIFPMPFDSCVFEIGPGGLTDPLIAALTKEEVDYVWIFAWREKIDRHPGWAVYFRSFASMPGFRPISTPAVGQIFTDEHLGNRGSFRLVAIDEEMALEMLTAARTVDGEAYLKEKFPGIDVNAAKQAVADMATEEGLMGVARRQLEIAFSNLLCVLGMLGTDKGVVVDHVQPRKKFLNQLRAKKGKALLEYEHRVIRIDPVLVRMPGLVALGGSHASPRLHWRRGHIRRLTEGKVVQVRPCVVGDRTKGTITHDYLLAPKPGVLNH